MKEALLSFFSPYFTLSHSIKHFSTALLTQKQLVSIGQGAG
jgi:hypothetical protein